MKCIYCDKPAKRRPDGFVVCHKCTEQNKVYTVMQKQALTIITRDQAIRKHIETIITHSDELKVRAETIRLLREALQNIEERADSEMGEWSSVAYGQLPISMSVFWYLREEAILALKKTKG